MAPVYFFYRARWSELLCHFSLTDTEFYILTYYKPRLVKKNSLGYIGQVVIFLLVQNVNYWKKLSTQN